MVSATGTGVEETSTRPVRENHTAPSRTAGHDDGGRSTLQQPLGGVRQAERRVERREVLVGGLHQVAGRDHPLDPLDHVGTASR